MGRGDEGERERERETLDRVLLEWNKGGNTSKNDDAKNKFQQSNNRSALSTDFDQQCFHISFETGSFIKPL
jgi:hypothetical protein